MLDWADPRSGFLDEPLPLARMDVVSTASLLRALGGGRRVSGRANGFRRERLLALLRLRAGEYASIPVVVDYVWGDEAEGGPMLVKGSVRIAVHQLREAGYGVEWGGGRLGYRLRVS